MKLKAILFSIIFFAFTLRVVGIGVYPTGFTQDEASLGYEAYSILKTGRDSWGVAFPLTLRSFGDFKLPLYTYLTIPSVAVFGLNEFATRLSNVIFGTLAVVFTYLMIIELGKRQKNLSFNIYHLAVLTAFLLAISPWHIGLSRGAYEANLATFFVPCGVWAYLKGLKNQKWLVLSALTFGLNLFSYHSARIFTPLIILVLLIFTYQEIGKNFKTNFLRYLLPLIIISFFGVLAAYTMLIGAGKRGMDVSILNPTDKWAAVADRRYQAVLKGLPDQIARIFSNKATFTFSKFAKTYISYLSPNFLFIEGAGEWTYGMVAGRGVLYFLELISVLVALVYFVKGERQSFLKFIIVWILLSVIPVSVSKNVGYAANRVTLMMPAIQVLSAYGIIKLGELLKIKYKYINNTNYYLVILIVLLISLTSFLEDYFYHAPYKQGGGMHYGMKEAMEYVGSLELNYKRVVLSRSLSAPNIWVQFYLNVDPRQVQLASKDWLRYEKEGHLYLDQLGEYRLGKYEFTNVDVSKLRTELVSNGPTLVVGKWDEFPYETKPLKTINYMDGKSNIYIVDSNIYK